MRFENAISAIAATGGSTNGVLHLLAIAARGRSRAVDRRLRHGLCPYADRRGHQARRPLRRDRSLQGRRRRARRARAGSRRARPRGRHRRRRPHAPSGRRRRLRASRTRRRRLVGQPAQGDGRAGDPARESRARTAASSSSPGTSVSCTGAGAGLRLRGSLLRRRQGALDRAGGRDRDPLRGSRRRSRHARDVARHRVAGRRGPWRRGRADHRRPLLRRDTRVDGRSCRARGVPRRADRARPRRRHDRRRCREPPARLEVPEDELRQRAADWTPPEPLYATGVFAKYAAAVGSASEGAITR